MRSLLLTLLFIYSVSEINSQSRDETVRQDYLIDVARTDIDHSKLNDPSTAHQVLQTIERKMAAGDARKMLKSYSDNLDRKVIIILSHVLDGTSAEQITDVKQITLHQNKKKSEYNKYLLEEKNILFVLISENDKGVRGASFKVKKEKSLFKSSFEDLRDLSDPLLGFAGSTPGSNITIRLVELNPQSLSAPCKIEIDYPSREQDIAISIHEKSNFSFQVGVSANQLSKKNVRIDNNQLIVELDSAQKEEWKSSLNVFLSWHPGRDIDRFEPVWKQGLRARGEVNNFKWFKHWTYNRMGLFAGVKLSTDPFQNLYFGANYAVTKDFFINGGFVWTSNLMEGNIDIGSISSVNDALDYARRDYERDWFIGFSFTPGSVSKILGLNEE